MLDSYLFIPSDKNRFLHKMVSLEPDFFVVDLEDSVSLNNKNIALKNVLGSSFPANTFFRIPFFENVFKHSNLKELVTKSKGKVVIPKVRKIKEIEYVLSFFKPSEEIKLIILVENPECLANLKDILFKFREHVHAVGFGSHDFCSETGIKHLPEFIKPIKMQLNLIVKAFSIKVLDGVDVNIRDTHSLIEECKNAFDLGMDGKFYIHPTQIDVANQIEYLTPQEKNTYKKVYYKLQSLDKNNFDILEVDGRIYEKPHISRILKLIKKMK